jgi:hypothetical protein
LLCQTRLSICATAAMTTAGGLVAAPVKLHTNCAVMFAFCGLFSCRPAQAGGPTGPFYAPGGLPPTPAAAAVAAAAGGMLSPRAASLDRRGSAFLDAAPGTVNRVTGSGWGHWGSGSAGEAAASGGAAAAAGGTAAEKRGAGLGQELITPLQVDPSIDFDQVRFD